MYYLAQEVVNDNSISSIALGFFTVIVTGVVTIIVTLLGVRNKAATASNKAEEAVNVAQKAVDNTHNVSNGFAGNVDRKLQWIVNELMINRKRDDEISSAFRDHLDWHLKDVHKHE